MSPRPGDRLAPLGDRPRPEGVLRPDLVFLDVESSGFGPGSYPVEIGVCDDGLAADSWLVSPAPGWTEWSGEAEAIHGLSRRRVEREGMSPGDAARRLSRALEGRVAVSDMPGLDASWIDALYAAAGQPRTFRVIDLHGTVFDGLRDTGRLAVDARLRAFAEACEACEAHFPHTHRAGEDARGAAAAWRATVDPAFLLSVLVAP